jgi:hypothetical protein
VRQSTMGKQRFTFLPSGSKSWLSSLLSASMVSEPVGESVTALSLRLPGRQGDTVDKHSQYRKHG